VVLGQSTDLGSGIRDGVGADSERADFRNHDCNTEEIEVSAR
jgi:hypothetical protein